MRRMAQNSFFFFFFPWFFLKFWFHWGETNLKSSESHCFTEISQYRGGRNSMHFQWCQWGEICFCQSNSNSKDCQQAPGTGAPVLWFSQSLWVSDSPVYRCFSGWMRTVHLRNLPNVKRESQTRTSCYGRKS